MRALQVQLHYAVKGIVILCFAGDAYTYNGLSGPWQTTVGGSGWVVWHSKARSMLNSG